jgi:hypothetical protein
MASLGRYKRRENAERCPDIRQDDGLRAGRNKFGIGGRKLAGEPGFEPRQTESESVVLPLHHSPMELPCKINALFAFMLGKSSAPPPGGKSPGAASRSCSRKLPALQACEMRFPAGPLPAIRRLYCITFRRPVYSVRLGVRMVWRGRPTLRARKKSPTLSCSMRCRGCPPVSLVIRGPGLRHRLMV